jgi:tRNA threonylcarbamoyladenosine modification (KEOPS) complex  Pcc1 subunit
MDGDIASSLGANAMKAKAVVRLKFPSERQLEIVSKALEPEVKKPATVRSRAMLKKDGALLTLSVEAGDTVALRAALNAYLRWINSILSILEVLEKP